MTASRRRSGRAALALVVLATLASACGGSAGAADCNTPIDQTREMTINLPPSLGGLRVAEEKKATDELLKESKVNSYLCDGRVFSLREGTELRGVLQIGRLTPDARPEEKEFRKTVADGMNAKRAPERIGETLVYKGNNNKQLIQVWFVEGFMVVLTVRESATVAGEPVGVDFKALTTEALSLRPVKV
jgi:hypothetical protein